MNLTILRKNINKNDKELLTLLKKRMVLSKKVGDYKKKRGLKIYDKTREKEIRSKLKQFKGLDEIFIQKIYKLIFKYSKKLQK